MTECLSYAERQIHYTYLQTERRSVLSQNDGIYVLKTLGSPAGDEYRIAHLSSVENVFEDRSWLFEAFCSAPVFYKETDMIEFAEEMQTLWQTEYGVCILKDFQDKIWFQLMNEESNGKSDLSRYSAHL